LESHPPGTIPFFTVGSTITFVTIVFNSFSYKNKTAVCRNVEVSRLSSAVTQNRLSSALLEVGDKPAGHQQLVELLHRFPIDMAVDHHR